MGTIRNILVDIPAMDESPSCLDLAIELAKHEQARITLITVLPSFRDLFSIFETDQQRQGMQGDLEKQAGSFLSMLSSKVSDCGVRCSSIIRNGLHSRQLIRQVIKDGHDLLIKSTGGESTLSTSSLEALDGKLARHCPSPVWIVKNSSLPLVGKQVVLAFDAIIDDPLHRELNLKLISLSKALASLHGTDLKILHAWDFDAANLLRGRIDNAKFLELSNSAQEAARKRLNECIQELKIDVKQSSIHVAQGVPSKVIVNYCNMNDVGNLIMGTIGHSGLAGFLIGNTAERVMNNVRCSLLIASPKQIKSSLMVKLTEELEDSNSSMVYV